MKQAIVLMGPTGSGKSTVARILAEELGFHHVSTGDIARQLIAEGGDDSWQALGLPAPEDEIRAGFIRAIEGHDLVVVDGMPRKIEQVYFLQEHFDHIDAVELKATRETVLGRLLDRGRVDDKEKTVRAKLRRYTRTQIHITRAIKEELLEGTVYKRYIMIGVDSRTPQQIASIIENQLV